MLRQSKKAKNSHFPLIQNGKEKLRERRASGYVEFGLSLCLLQMMRYRLLLHTVLGQFAAEFETAEGRFSTSTSEAKRVGRSLWVRNELLLQVEEFKYFVREFVRLMNVSGPR